MNLHILEDNSVRTRVLKQHLHMLATQIQSFYLHFRSFVRSLPLLYSLRHKDHEQLRCVLPCVADALPRAPYCRAAESSWMKLLSQTYLHKLKVVFQAKKNIIAEMGMDEGVVVLLSILHTWNLQVARQEWENGRADNRANKPRGILQLE